MSKSSCLDKFKLLKTNRPIDKKQVKKLEGVIKKHGYIKSLPIVVDKHYNILDGQHRFMACKNLGITPPFVVDKSISINALSDINTVQKNWNVGDYIHHYSELGNSNYLELALFMKEFKISASVAMTLIQNQISGGGETELIRSGKFVAEKSVMDEARDRAENIMSSIRLMRIPAKERLVRALIVANRDENFKFQTFWSKLSFQSDVPAICSTTQGYLNMIQKIYNNKNQSKIAIAQ